MSKPDPIFSKPKSGSQDDSNSQEEQNPENHTMPFDGQPDDNKQENQQDGEANLQEQAEKAVADQHGKNATENPNYDELVEDAKQQIQDATEQNKSM